MRGRNSDELPPSSALPENNPRRRSPPRMDLVKSAAKMVEKNPALVARIKLPNGGAARMAKTAGA